MQQILSYTEKDFENLSWHDNHVYGIFLEKDTEGEDWKSDVIFDIDFITDWLCGIDRRAEFMIAAATLRFHDVTDLKINIDWGNSNFQTILNYFSIDSIERSIVQDQRICLDHPYFNWVINGHLPFGGGVISFGASGFTQTLRQDPILCKDQNLPSAKRARLIGAS